MRLTPISNKADYVRCVAPLAGVASGLRRDHGTNADILLFAIEDE